MSNEIKDKPWYKQKTIQGGIVYTVGQIMAMSPTTVVLFSVGTVFPVTIPMIAVGVQLIGGIWAGWGIVDWKKKVTRAITK